MKAESIMDSPEVNGIGWTAVVAAWFLAGVQWITEHGNGLIVGVSGLLGIIFLVHKIKMIRIELRLKKKELEKIEKEK
jgi:hypothetical protein